MSLDQNAITVSGLQKTYSDGIFRRKRFAALKGIDLSVPEGQIFGLLGPNGAGKTTFVKIMLGLVGKTAGQTQLLGFEAGSTSARRLIGYLPENLRMRQHHTANTALEFYGGLSGLPLKEIRSKRAKLLEKVGLSDWADAGIKKFSKGMLQRLGLAQALLHDPRMLFLDEPTDGLDPQARAEVRDILSRLRGEGKTIFINSHILQEVELVCDSVAILDQGELKYCGSVRKIGDFIEQSTGIRTGLGITFLTEGTIDQIRKLVEPQPDDSITLSSEGLVEYYSTRIDPEFINATIDSLRQNDISIHEVARKNVSLEDAFLTILSSEPQSTSDEPGGPA